ncbi:hypothetical protein CHS0354_032657 [Potamilus streckersoni]|uniref:Uncharacterized protein n=1 Tax=Potamilus streckersoni TaxID=2493646 RepID=A0AAE0WDS5_9BIVA|nr:hypothetical protein CHS0354_032657 [Potamilus streckersoni]
MADNKVSPSQSEKNLGQGQDSNKVNTRLQWVAKARFKAGVDKQPEIKHIDKVVENRPEQKPIDNSNETKWILKNINVNTRISNDESEGKSICQCEKNQTKHASNDENQQTQSEIENANAFGEITFDSGQYVAKYVLVDSNTKPSTVLELMKKKWKLEMPNLLISVAGSKENFKKSRLSDSCPSSLVKAVKGTGAWIITDGKQDYVKECDGKGVMTDEQPIIIVGVTQLETIHNKHQGSWPAEYPIEKISLDPNHSHFILVADGIEDSLPTKTVFREKLESEITEKKRATGVLFVMLVFEWDQDISKTVHNALARNIPVIIVKAYHQEERGTEAESEIPEDISKSKLIHICEWNSEPCDFHIRFAILQALSKATMHNVRNKMTNAMYQLKLAFDKNLFDIAKNITMDTGQQAAIRESCMMAAILLNKVEYVEQILDNGFDLKTFLTKKRHLELYERESKTTIFKDLLAKMRKQKKQKVSAERITLQSLVRRKKNEMTNTIHLKDVNDLIEYLLGDSNLQFKRYATIDQENTIRNPESEPADKHTQETSDDHIPFMDLFIWSVLNNRQDMAKLFWRYGKDAIAAALFAHALLSAMSHQIDDKDFTEQCEKHIREFTNLAIGVLKECHKKDVNLAKNLLIQEQSQWEETSCVLIAVKAKNKQFLSEYACQDVFNNIWMGNIDQETGSICNNLKLLLCIFFPFVILCWDAFRENEESEQASDDQETSSNEQTDSNSKQSAHREKTNTTVRSQKTQETKKCSIECERIVYFYQAPVVIFFHNVISYMIFLGLYSYILISKFDRYLSWEEILLCVWVFSIFTQEVIQVCTTPSKDWPSRLCNYVRDGWNILDIVTLVLFLSGMILRIFDHPQVSEAAHIVLGVNLITFYLRLLHIFSAHRELGPKLIMILHMVYNLAYFFMILLVFIVAYGISSHAILYPHTAPSLETLTDIFRRPYWNIYGELMLDKIEGSVDCTNDPEVYKTGSQPRCPTESGKYFVPVLMGVYMLMCNILLLNLLIAVFSTTFQKVQDNSYLYWSYQQYSLINEYANRPFLAPPLIIFVHVYKLIRLIVTTCKRKCCNKDKKRNADNDAEQNAFLTSVKNRKNLRVEEYEMAKKFYENRMKNNSAAVSEAGSTNVEKRMENMEKQMNLIIKTLNEIRPRI